MKVGTVVVQGYHLQKITTTRKPLRAIEELIWNGFDADADEVSVEFEEGPLVKINLIRITDRGAPSHTLKLKNYLNLSEGPGKPNKRRPAKADLFTARMAKGASRRFPLAET